MGNGESGLPAQEHAVLPSVFRRETARKKICSMSDVSIAPVDILCSACVTHVTCMYACVTCVHVWSLNKDFLQPCAMCEYISVMIFTVC